MGADFLIRELDRRDVEVVRLNTERSPGWQLSLVPGEGWAAIGSGHALSSADCQGVWWRRPEVPRIVADEVGESARRAVEEQWRGFLRAMASVSGPNWVSPPAAISAAEDKGLQLARARQAGLVVPETLWTNSLNQAQSFLERCAGRAVVKSVTSAWWQDGGRGWFVFARVVEPFDLPPAEQLATAPVLLQRAITPKRDVRVTVLGNRALAAVRVQPDAEPDDVDWRRGGEAPWIPYDLPDAVAVSCIQLVAGFGLRFSGVDLVLDEAGEYWFLESNPNGEWGWLQRAGLPIAQGLADELTA